ncbi:hypothetical protein GWI33_018588 [Rhynchophorus ferrugineus]|uniref:Uncharacterized protein n=1 Tax=Rhynchophorus ferrugineus TaxID=354439 RepID=A0A834HUK6_RHYFE|nr:hypothetical protein GWI33_018588 [Rhynchophorus ferrugineus]
MYPKSGSGSFCKVTGGKTNPLVMEEMRFKRYKSRCVFGGNLINRLQRRYSADISINVGEGGLESTEDEIADDMGKYREYKRLQRIVYFTSIVNLSRSSSHPFVKMFSFTGSHPTKLKQIFVLVEGAIETDQKRQ